MQNKLAKTYNFQRNVLHIVEICWCARHKDVGAPGVRHVGRQRSQESEVGYDQQQGRERKVLALRIRGDVVLDVGLVFLESN